MKIVFGCKVNNNGSTMVVTSVNVNNSNLFNHIQGKKSSINLNNMVNNEQDVCVVKIYF